MAQELGVGYIIISPSTKGLGKAIEGSIGDGAGKGVAKSSKTILTRLSGTFTKVGKIGVGAIGTVTGALTGLAAKGGFDRALNIERAQTKLKALGHDTKSVDGIMNDALASVKGTAFGLGDAASVAAGMVASGVKQGKQLATVLATVGDVAQVSGRSFSDMGLIFQQVAAKGKLQGDEMLQLMQSGIPVLQYLADHFKVTSAEAQDMVSAGKVSFEEFEEAMREHLGGAAQSAGESFDGAMGNVKAAFSRLGETVATPVIQGLTGLFNQAIPMIDGFTAQATPILERVGDGLRTGLEQALPAVQDAMEHVGVLVAACDDLGHYAEAAATALGGLAGGLAAIKTSQGIVAAAQSSRDLAAMLQLAVDPAAEGANTLIRLSNAAKAYDGVASGLVGTIGGMSGKLGGIAAAAGKAGGGLKGLSSALGLGPWGLVAAGVATVAGALAAFFTQTETGRAAWDGLVELLQPLWQTVQDAWQSALPALQDLVQSFGDTISGIASTTGPALGELAATVGPMLSAFADAVVTLLAPISANLPALAAAFQDLGQDIAGAVQACTPAFRQLADAFTQAWGQIAPALGDLAATVAPVLAQIAGLVMDLVAQLAGPLATVLTAGAGVIATIVAATAGLLPLIGQIIASVASVMTVVAALAANLIGALLPVITGIINGVTALLPVISTAVTAILGVVTPAVTMMAGIIQGLLTTLQGVINFVTGVFTGDWSQAWEGVKQIFSGVWQQLTSLLTGAWNMIQAIIRGGLATLLAAWTAGWNAVGSFFTSIWTGLKNAASAGVDAVVRVVTGIRSRITGFFSDAASWLVDAGGNLLRGLWNGINDAVGWVVAQIGGLKDAIVGGIKKLFGIHSPSRVMRDEVGIMIGRGLAEGIRRSETLVGKAGDRLAAAAMPDQIPLPAFDDGGLATTVRRAMASYRVDMTVGDAAGGRDAASIGRQTVVYLTYNGATSTPSDRVAGLLELLGDELEHSLQTA
ncbi:tape measure protein [Bifidobacterium samirii]|uniref:Tape measure domain-containing protein n=1 Tax=Bifidobacterium samirii TaxID=2306974 RepID=A0A430FJU8_9BIFI|nr:tape measure protein [Bifidobacterium samirii]RSX53031.1 tape measure domain-containing protein [Bifidobacterium samirii]